MYYCMDGIIACLFVLVFWKLDVKVDKADSSDGFLKVVKRISNPMMFLLVLNIFFHGSMYGILQYYTIFAQEELAASSLMISMKKLYQATIIIES